MHDVLWPCIDAEYVYTLFIYSWLLSDRYIKWLKATDKTRMSSTPMKETLNSSGRSESPASILKNRKITQHLKNVLEQSPRDLLVHHELSVNEMPGGLREAYIRGHYREPHQKFTSYLGSIFEIHNESLNIWTAILRYDTHLWLKTCFIRQLAIKDNSNWLLYFLCSLNRN